MSDKNNSHRKKKNPKYFFRRLAAFLILFILIWHFNNYNVRINEVKINSPKIDASVKIAVLSDYHADSKYGIRPSTILKKLDKINPDIVMYLGDMYSRKSPPEDIELAESLMIDTVKAGYEVFFVSGDHDTSVEYLNVLMQNGINVMNYQSMNLNIMDNNICIYGINNAYFSGSFDLSKEFQPDPECYNILMAHIPMYDYYNDFGADLTICGDTHGGMIQLPFGMGPVYNNNTDEWFPQFVNRSEKVYDKGIFNLDEKYKYMFITSGLGNYPFPARFNNRPEIAVIDINPI